MTARSTLLGAAGLLVLLTGAATAQNGAAKASGFGALHPAKTPVQPVAAVQNDEAACNRTRRRLWIEAEGWVVRRITTCR